MSGESEPKLTSGNRFTFLASPLLERSNGQ